MGFQKKMLGVEFAEGSEQAAGIQFEAVGRTGCLHDAWLWNTFSTPLRKLRVIGSKERLDEK